MRIRLTRKFCELIDDVNLSKYRVGDLIELPPRDAQMLLAEGWALAEVEESEPAEIVQFSDRKKKLPRTA